MDKNFVVGLAINVNCKIKECPCKNKGDFYELFQKDTASCKLGWYINRYPISGPTLLYCNNLRAKHSRCETSAVAACI